MGYGIDQMCKNRSIVPRSYTSVRDPLPLTVFEFSDGTELVDRNGDGSIDGQSYVSVGGEKNIDHFTSSHPCVKNNALEYWRSNLIVGINSLLDRVEKSKPFKAILSDRPLEHVLQASTSTSRITDDKGERKKTNFKITIVERDLFKITIGERNVLYKTDSSTLYVIEGSISEDGKVDLLIRDDERIIVNIRGDSSVFARSAAHGFLARAKEIAGSKH